MKNVKICFAIVNVFAGTSLFAWNPFCSSDWTKDKIYSTDNVVIVSSIDPNYLVSRVQYNFDRIKMLDLMYEKIKSEHGTIGEGGWGICEDDNEIWKYFNEAKNKYFNKWKDCVIENDASIVTLRKKLELNAYELSNIMNYFRLKDFYEKDADWLKLSKELEDLKSQRQVMIANKKITQTLLFPWISTVSSCFTGEIKDELDFNNYLSDLKKENVSSAVKVSNKKLGILWALVSLNNDRIEKNQFDKLELQNEKIEMIEQLKFMQDNFDFSKFKHDQLSSVFVNADGVSIDKNKVRTVMNYFGADFTDTRRALKISNMRNNSKSDSIRDNAVFAFVSAADKLIDKGNSSFGISRNIMANILIADAIESEAFPVVSELRDVFVEGSAEDYNIEKAIEDGVSNYFATKSTSELQVSTLLSNIQSQQRLILSKEKEINRNERDLVLNQSQKIELQNIINSFYVSLAENKAKLDDFIKLDPSADINGQPSIDKQIESKKTEILAKENLLIDGYTKANKDERRKFLRDYDLANSMLYSSDIVGGNCANLVFNKKAQYEIDKEFPDSKYQDKQL